MYGLFEAGTCMYLCTFWYVHVLTISKRTLTQFQRIPFTKASLNRKTLFDLQIFGLHLKMLQTIHF